MTVRLSGPEETHSHLFRGVKWLGVGTLTYHAIHLTASILLARLLWPEEFGVFAAALVAIQIGLCFVDPGLSATVVQRAAPSESHIHTVFWSIFSTGLLAALAASLASDFYESMIGTSGSGAVLAMLSPVPIINGSCAVPLALLHRRLQFRAIAGIEILSTFLQAVTASTMALAEFGVFSLAGGQLVRQITVFSASWVLSGHRPRLHFSVKELSGCLPLASPLFGLALVGTYLNQIDVYLVARILGAATLGIYNRALFMTKLLSQQIAALVQRAAFPSFSRVQKETDQIRSVLLQFVSVSACLSIPAMAGLYLSAPAIVSGLFGPRWLDAVPVVRILSPAGVFWAIEALNGPILMARNKVRSWFMSELTGAVALTVVLIAAAGEGILAFAAAILSFVVVRSLVTFWLTLSEVRGTAASLLQRLWAPLGATAVMSAGIAPLEPLMSPQESPWLFLAIVVPGGVTTFVATLAVLNASQLKFVAKAMHAMVAPGRTASRQVDSYPPRS